MKKRMLALILCLVFCFSLMGVAMASEEVEDEEAEEEVVVVEAEAPEEDGAAEDEVVVEGGIVTYADVSMEWVISDPNDTQDFDISEIGTVSDVQVDGTSYAQTGTNVMGTDVTYWEVNGTTITLAADLAFPGGGTVTVIGSEGTLIITATVDSSSSSGGGTTASQETKGTWDGENDYVINFYGSASVTDFVATVDGEDVTDIVSYASNGESAGPTEGINVTFPASYLATLSEGEHTIEMSYTMGAGPSQGNIASVTYTLTIESSSVEDEPEEVEPVAPFITIDYGYWGTAKDISYVGHVTITVTNTDDVDSIDSVQIDGEDIEEVIIDGPTAMIPAEYLSTLDDGDYTITVTTAGLVSNGVTLTIENEEVVATLDSVAYQYIEGEDLVIEVVSGMDEVTSVIIGETEMEFTMEDGIITIAAENLEAAVSGLEDSTVVITVYGTYEGEESEASATLVLEQKQESTGSLNPAEANWEIGEDSEGLSFGSAISVDSVKIWDVNGLPQTLTEDQYKVSEEVNEDGEYIVTIYAAVLNTLPDGGNELQVLDAEEDVYTGVINVTSEEITVSISTSTWGEGGNDIIITVTGFNVISVSVGDTELVEGEDYTVGNGGITISAKYLATLELGNYTITITGVNAREEVTQTIRLTVAEEYVAPADGGTEDDDNEESVDADVDDSNDNSNSGGGESEVPAQPEVPSDSGSDSTDPDDTENIDPGFSQGGTTENNTNNETAGGASDEQESGDDSNYSASGEVAEGANSSNSAGGSSTSPQTGDTNTLGIWCAVILLCGAALIGTAVVLKKRENG